MALILDEPFGALDAQLKLILQDELLKIWDRTKKTMIFVTHDLGEAITLADRVVVFTGRPGRLIRSTSMFFGQWGPQDGTSFVR